MKSINTFEGYPMARPDPYKLEPGYGWEWRTWCDCCGEELPVADTIPGPAGSEWEDCSLCPDCYTTEVKDAC